MLAALAVQPGDREEVKRQGLTVQPIVLPDKKIADPEGSCAWFLRRMWSADGK